MQQDNSSYSVTSPDLLLTDDGITVLITSTDQKFIDDIKHIYEKYVDTSIVFNIQQIPTTESTVSWMWYVSRPADMMIVDLDTCAWVDVCAAILKPQTDNHSVVFFSKKHKKREAVRLLNATAEFIILKEVDHIDTFLKHQLGIT